MSTHPQFGARAIMDGCGIVVRICPATSNLPTRMSESGWKALCKSTRQRERFPGHTAASEIRRRLNYCEICKGKIRPEGLEIIPAAEMAALKQHHREEESMAKTGGKCTACGRSTGALSTCHGEKLCASCSAVYSAANNRPTVLVESLRKLQPQLLEELAGSPTVQVSVESEALKRIAKAVGYKGEDGEVLVQAVQALATTHMQDCDGCKEGYNEQIADLQVELERLRKKLFNPLEWSADVAMAMGLEQESLGVGELGDAVIQTAALLEESERQLDESRRHGLRKNDAMRAQLEAIQDIASRLGLAEDADTEMIIAAIIGIEAGCERFRNLAEAAEKRADQLDTDISRCHVAARIDRDIPLAQLIIALREDNEAMTERLTEIRAELGVEVQGDVVVAVRSALHQSRHNQDLADRLALAEAENSRLADLLDQQNESLSLYVDPTHDDLVTFAMRVIRGEVIVAHCKEVG